MFRFCLKFFPETFLISRNEQDIIKMYIGLDVKYSLFLADVDESNIFPDRFSKILKYQIS